jgi:Zn finger protein HypA/HybF involved in hydrogenase expression
MNSQKTIFVEKEDYSSACVRCGKFSTEYKTLGQCPHCNYDYEEDKVIDK